MKGVVKYFNEAKGFGFADVEGKSHFFHISEMYMDICENWTPKKGDVIYHVFTKQGRKGPVIAKGTSPKRFEREKRETDAKTLGEKMQSLVGAKTSNGHEITKVSVDRDEVTCYFKIPEKCHYNYNSYVIKSNDKKEDVLKGVDERVRVGMTAKYSPSSGDDGNPYWYSHD